MHDVAVVGGSLAGAMTAYHLARAGLRIVLLEQAEHPPRRKACGEGLFPAGVRELAAAGLLAELEGCSAPIEGVRFHAYGAVASARLGHGGATARGVRRDVLDALVLAHAERAGVDVRRGVTATGLVIHARRAAGVQTAAGTVNARVIVGADGLNSRVRRLAGLETRTRGDRYGVSAHVRLERPAGPWVDVHFARDHELYLTPVGPHEINVALLTRRPAMARFAGGLGPAFDQFFVTHPAMPAGWTRTSEVAAAGPFHQRARRAFRSNVVLVGDAAGFFDGITGEGMALALVSARLAAEAIRAHLECGSVEPFRSYDQERAALARNSELLGRLTLFLSPKPALARWSTRNLSRRPATFDRLTAISAGERPMRSLRPRDLLALALGL